MDKMVFMDKLLIRNYFILLNSINMHFMILKDLNGQVLKFLIKK